jgi:RNA polymerase sigma factor (TIGR02999 family)
VREPEVRGTGGVRSACLGLAAWMAGGLDRGARRMAGCEMTPKPPATDPPDRNANGPAGPRASPEEVTRLLRRWGDGDESALDRLMPLVYDELHRVAHRRLAGEHTGHTLQTTDLVHEAYARFADADLRWSDRAHFFALAARTMRRILVDYARARSAAKRGGDVSPVTLHTAIEAEGGAFHAIDLLALHDALERLAKQDARKAEVVEAHIFGGLTYQETAGALGISPATVDRELRLAKAWLARELAP